MHPSPKPLKFAHARTPQPYGVAVSETIYGLDIEADTTVNGLDPAVAPLEAIALVGPDLSVVIRGSEAQMLHELDDLLAQVSPGVIITWNGSSFDLPFLETRARLNNIELGLNLTPRPGSVQQRFLASWYQHRHLDAYLAYSYELTSVIAVSCGLKAVAALDGLKPIQVDVERLHQLPQDVVDAYVTSDAVVTRALVTRRWQWAEQFIDRCEPKRVGETRLGRQDQPEPRPRHHELR